MDIQKRKKPLVPTTYAQIMLRLAEGIGIDRSEITESLGFTIHTGRFRGMVTRLSIEQQEHIARAIIHTAKGRGIDTSGFGFDLGLKLAPMSHGTLASALLSQTTARTSLRLFLKFAPLIIPAIRVTLIEEPNISRIRFTEELMISPDLKSHFYDLLLSGIWRFAQVIIGTSPENLTLCFTHEEPTSFYRHRDFLPKCKFDMDINEVLFPTYLLDTRISTGNSIVGKDFEEECSNELRLINDDTDIISNISNIIRNTPNHYTDAESISRELHISSATLRRKLNKKGTSIRKILEDLRNEESKFLLVNTSLSIEKISSRLGYRDPANFTRAFTRWNKISPSSWRSNHATNK